MHSVTIGAGEYLCRPGGCQVQDEAGLVRRAQQLDQEALTQIYEENFDRIYRYVVLKIGDRTEA